jgi:hypothetical protein
MAQVVAPPLGRFIDSHSRTAILCGSIRLIFHAEEAPMRWILLLVSVFAFALAFASKSPSIMGLGLVLGFGCLFGSLFGFAAARIASTSRPDVALLTDRDISLLRASMRKPDANAAPSSGNLQPPDNV